MYWNDDESDRGLPVPDDVVDLRFAIDCRRIPVDHAYALSRALQDACPWIADEASIAVHTIHVAGSQNGWQRPARSADAYLMVSRRTKLAIRAPKHRVDALRRELEGRTLEVAGCRLSIGEGKIRRLSADPALLARYVASEGHSTEADFLAWVARELSRMGIRARKALCGMEATLAAPTGSLPTRSLLLAALSPEESVRLQELGLGPNRQMGCGIFIPHKGVEAVLRPGG